MNIATVHSRGLIAMSAPEVQVEVHLANGLPAFHIVGLPKTEVRESGDRVRAALQNLNFEFPNRRITVNLAPADLPKGSGRFDLPIALGILCASGQIPAGLVDNIEAVGELSLTGEVRPIRGAIAMALAVRRAGQNRTLVLPAANAVEAAMIEGVRLSGLSHLVDVVGTGKASSRADIEPVALGHDVTAAEVTVGVTADKAAAEARAETQRRDKRVQERGQRGKPPPTIGRFTFPLHQSAPPPDTAATGASSNVTPLRTNVRGNARNSIADRASVNGNGQAARLAPDTDACLRLDFADVCGHPIARRMLEIAAAGEHSVLLLGPPGAGKSMLAQRLSTILPPLGDDDAAEVAALASLCGRFDPARWGERPVRSPHHTSSAPALVGGGSNPRPGEISLAHHGVLFLDELPEFARPVLEALREPLETGRITLSRAMHHVDFPARFQFIAAMNPCPCGYLGQADGRCRCTPDQVQRYRSRISGPLLDRIDLRLEVEALPPAEMLNAVGGEASAGIRQRVIAARQQAMARQQMPNSRLSGELLGQHAATDAGAKALLHQAVAHLGLSARAMTRTIQVARTVADLKSAPLINADHIAEALQFRRAMAH